jgi:hypothetical protein
MEEMRMANVNCLRCRFRHEDNGNCTAVGGFCTAVPAAHCPLLREYLDTELTPQEVISMKFEWCAMMDALNSIGGGYTRLRELAEADKDGRVVVLPCKDWLEVVFGDQVLFWGIDKDYVEQPIREISLDDADRIGWYDGYKTVFLKGTDENGEAWEFYPEEIGKTVFLTREEAEKALEAKKDE